MQTLNVGLIGYKFMGKAHSNAYRQVGRFFDLPINFHMHTICGRDQSALTSAANKLGWAKTETDWRTVVENPEVDLIDISTPGNTHCEIACAAAENGKIVFCEKPLANTTAESAKMLAAVEKCGKPHAVFHNYRYVPAVQLAQKIIAEGALGKLHHIRAVYLQDWIASPEFPMVWRLDREQAGSGALGDIGSHIIDLARFLVGEFAEVVGTSETFVKDRRYEDGSMGQVTVDDAAIWLARFECGALGTFEAARFALGRRNYNTFEINGSKGSIRFNLERMNELEFYNGTDPEDVQGFRTINVTESCHEYAAPYWPNGHIIGYEHTFINLLAAAATGISNCQLPTPNFYDGHACQLVLDAVERSASAKIWVQL